MASAIDDYFQALSHIDRGAYLACFSQDATVLDPYDAPALHGSEGLNKFMDNMERTWNSFEMSLGTSYAAGDRVAVNWEAKATAKSGKTAEFAGINVFTLNKDGLISRLEGYWDFKAMVAQIS